MNADYTGGWQGLRDKLLASGGTASGKFGTAARQMEMGRVNKLADTNTAYDAMALQQKNNAASLAERLLGLNFGQTTTGTNVSTASGENVAPGDAFAGALNNIYAALYGMFPLATGD